MKEPNAKKNARWVFETVQIILIISSLICFTEKVYGSSPYSPITYIYYNDKKIKNHQKIVSFSFLHYFFVFGTDDRLVLVNRNQIIPISSLMEIV